MNTLTSEKLPASLESIYSESIDSSSHWIKVRFDHLLRLLLIWQDFSGQIITQLFGSLFHSPMASDSR